MAKSNRDRVSEVMDALRTGLGPFVLREYKQVYKGARYLQEIELNLYSSAYAAPHLPGHRPCAQAIAKDDLETKHGSLCQRTAMIARFLFPSLATHATNTAQGLVARQRWFGRVAMLPDAGVALGGHRDALPPPCSAGVVEYVWPHQGGSSASSPPGRHCVYTPWCNRVRSRLPPTNPSATDPALPLDDRATGIPLATSTGMQSLDPSRAPAPHVDATLPVVDASFPAYPR